MGRAVSDLEREEGGAAQPRWRRMMRPLMKWGEEAIAMEAIRKTQTQPDSDRDRTFPMSHAAVLYVEDDEVDVADRRRAPLLRPQAAPMVSAGLAKNWGGHTAAPVRPSARPTDGRS